MNLRALAVDRRASSSRYTADFEREAEDEKADDAPLPRERGCKRGHTRDDRQHDAARDDRADQRRVHEPVRPRPRQPPHEALVGRSEACVREQHLRHEQAEEDRERPRSRRTRAGGRRQRSASASPGSTAGQARRQRRGRHRREPGRTRAAPNCGATSTGPPDARRRPTCESVGCHIPQVSQTARTETSQLVLPLALDLVVALALGALAALAAFAYMRSPATSNHPALQAAEGVGELVRPHPWLRRMLASRLDRSVASGMLLTLALGAAVGGGLLLGLLAYFVRSLPATQRLDNSAAAWGFDHRTHALDSRPAPDHRSRHRTGRHRAGARRAGGRLLPDARPLVRPVHPRRDDRPGGPDASR